MIKRLALAALAALCLIVPARAQNNWSTPGGAGASGYVGMYLNAQNLAVPDSAAAPHPVTCISGCAAPTAPTIAATNTGQLPVTTSSARILLGDATLNFPNLIIYNYGSNTAFVVLGGSAVTATTSGTPVAPGQQIQIPQVSTSNTNLAAITSTGTATLSIIQSSSPMQIGGGGSGGGGGGGNVNITQIQGAAPSATNPLWIQPGTGATFAVTGTFWQATQPVSNAGTFAVQAAQSGSWAVTANAGTNLNTSALATSANQATNGATTAHTCSTGGFSELGCLGQIDDDVKSSIAAGTNVIGFTSNDPCAQATKLGAPISLTASGQVITGTASKKTYICSIDVMSGTAQNVALVEGTGTTCATNIFGLAGGTTAATGWNFAANGGLTKGSGAGTVYSPSADTNATAANVCLLSSSTGQISGQITYVQQ